jgi:hypothetical protein
MINGAGGAMPAAAGPLGVAARDANLDVRRAAVRSLADWVRRPDVGAEVGAALRAALADVRAYARRALAPVPQPG